MLSDSDSGDHSTQLVQSSVKKPRIFEEPAICKAYSQQKSLFLFNLKTFVSGHKARLVFHQVRERIGRRLKFRGGSVGRNYRGMIKSRRGISRSRNGGDAGGWEMGGCTQDPWHSSPSFPPKLSLSKHFVLMCAISSSPIQIRIWMWQRQKKLIGKLALPTEKLLPVRKVFERCSKINPLNKVISRLCLKKSQIVWNVSR